LYHSFEGGLPFHFPGCYSGLVSIAVPFLLGSDADIQYPFYQLSVLFPQFNRSSPSPARNE
jgi:hypothetical protein